MSDVKSTMKPCESCGEETVDWVKVCPKCGTELKMRTGSKISLLLCIAVGLWFIGWVASYTGVFIASLLFIGVPLTVVVMRTSWFKKWNKARLEKKAAAPKRLLDVWEVLILFFGLCTGNYLMVIALAVIFVVIKL